MAGGSPIIGYTTDGTPLNILVESDGGTPARGKLVITFD